MGRILHVLYANKYKHNFYLFAFNFSLLSRAFNLNASQRHSRRDPVEIKSKKKNSELLTGELLAGEQLSASNWPDTLCRGFSL